MALLRCCLGSSCMGHAVLPCAAVLCNHCLPMVPLLLLPLPAATSTATATATATAATAAVVMPLYSLLQQ
jgi:hypothetical protein